jgi:hypothetical protein
MRTHFSSFVFSKVAKICSYEMRMGSTFQSKIFNYLQSSNSNTINKQVTGALNKDLSLAEFALKNILKSFDAHKGTKPGSLVSSKLYAESMEKIRQMNCLQNENLEKQELVKMLFYVGLQKKSHRSQDLMQAMMSRIPQYLDKFTLYDACILANTVYKTSTKSLHPSIIKHIRKVFEDNFHVIINDPAVLVCFVKFYRQFSVFDYELLEKLSSNIDVWASNFTVRAHVLALFAEAKFYNTKATGTLVNLGLQEMKNSSKPVRSNSKYLRAKDVARFLWAISVLGGNLTSEEIENVVWPWIFKQLNETNEYYKKPSLMLDTLLSLSILGYYSAELIQWMTSQNVLQQVLGNTLFYITRWLLIS